MNSPIIYIIINRLLIIHILGFGEVGMVVGMDAVMAAAMVGDMGVMDVEVVMDIGEVVAGIEHP